jgi:cyclopropane fatty-acyl-phospholipid synthase-like methyltransferase
MSEAEQVTAAYDRIAEAWRAGRAAAGPEFRGRILLDRLIAPLPGDARILDVGCGCGIPIARHLADLGFRVAGLDGSARMVELARQAVPEADFLHGDMRTAEVAGPFDAVVAWDSVFHLPRSEHAAMFGRFGSWLRPGGRLLVSLGGSGDDGFTSEMHGETFFYSGHEPSEALELLRGAGFRIEHWEVDDPSSRGHIAVLAVRVPA